MPANKACVALLSSYSTIKRGEMPTTPGLEPFEQIFMDFRNWLWRLGLIDEWLQLCLPPAHIMPLTELMAHLMIDAKRRHAHGLVQTNAARVGQRYPRKDVKVALSAQHV